jgi:glycerol-3-phosphate acyltransferase PlsY
MVFLIVAFWSRMVSLASVVAAALAPLAFWIFSYRGVVWLGFTLAVLIIVRHRDNIQRMISGSEPKFHL